MSLIEELGKELGKDELPMVHVGDVVQVHYLIKEGDKERVQLFTGTVIAIKGRGIAKVVVVRRIVQGEGVERIFPLHSPRVQNIVISRRGKVRKARLYYLRDRVGKQTRVEELVGEKAKRDRDALKGSREGADVDAEPEGKDSPTDAETEAVEV